LKKILISIIILAILAVPTVALAKSDNAANDNPSTGLWLYEKDAEWNIVDDGAWGHMQFTGKDGTKFVFNGKGLDAWVEYSLIIYSDPWPGSPVCLGSAVANQGGNVQIKGDATLICSGDKIWLVPSSDVDCGVGMTAWNPGNYLFEHTLIP